MTAMLVAALALAPPNDVLVVVNKDASTVSVITVETGATLVTLPTGGQPYRIVFSPDGGRVLVTTPATDAVRLFDAATRRELGRLKTPASSGGPGALRSRLESGRRVVPCHALRRSPGAVVNLEKMSLERHLTAGPGADGIACARRPSRRDVTIFGGVP